MTGSSHGSPRTAAENPRRAHLVLFHLAAFAIFSSWAFGGQSPWSRQIIAWWGTVGIGLFVYLSITRRPDGRRHPAWRLLWPLWLYDLLVGVSCFNPGLREVIAGGQASLVVGDPRPWLPSAALPHLAARELWQFNGLVLSAFNLLLAFDRRGQIRRLFFIFAANAVLLAVLGTFQKLAGSTGLWFGLVPSPNDHFFATFIYHNHWGAFVLLNMAACLGLLLHQIRRGGHRDFWRSPLLLGAVATLLLAASVPLSTSRSCTVLAAALLAGALVHLLGRLVIRRREEGRSAALPALGIVLAALLAAGAIGWIGRGVIAQRSRLTATQISQLTEERTLTSRLILYRDTWRMASAKPWFGWGLESYARVFQIYNTQRPVERWFQTPVYAEAHNDWFQSLAEVGFVGTLALVALGGLPLRGQCRRLWRSFFPRYLLAGALLLLLYAWLEFPFANPSVVLAFWASLYGAARHATLDDEAAAAGPAK